MTALLELDFARLKITKVSDLGPPSQSDSSTTRGDNSLLSQSPYKWGDGDAWYKNKNKSLQNGMDVF